MTTQRIEIPARAIPVLTNQARYRVLYGGRGSAKSWAIARILIARCMVAKTRVLCAREFQNSIEESVHHLLASQIEALGLSAMWDIQRTHIVGPHGSEFVFVGLARNINSIKSYEDFDVCWVEEGQAVRKRSWDVLTPTIRKPGSEIWVSMNPELEIDESYQRFVADTPTGCLKTELNWRDNPWFPPELDAERLDCKRRDPAGYENIWEGRPRAAVEGAIYADQLRAARDDGRMTSVPYDAALPVDTGWDVGILDPTAIWFMQQARGGEIRVIDYYEACDEPLNHYAQVLKDKCYTYGIHYAPHDMRQREWTNGKARIAAAADLGIRFETVPASDIEDGINAVKLAFPRLIFDAKKTAPGIQALSHYRRAFNERLNEFKPMPVHDWASHGADALRTFIMGAKGFRDRKTAPIKYPSIGVI